MKIRNKKRKTKERRKEIYKRNINARNDQIQLSSFIDLIAEEGISFHHYYIFVQKVCIVVLFLLPYIQQLQMDKNICSFRRRYKEEQRSTNIAIFPDSGSSQINIAPTQKFEQIRKENKVSFSFNYFKYAFSLVTLFIVVLIFFSFYFFFVSDIFLSFHFTCKYHLFIFPTYIHDNDIVVSTLLLFLLSSLSNLSILLSSLCNPPFLLSFLTRTIHNSWYKHSSQLHCQSLQYNIQQYESHVSSYWQ